MPVTASRTVARRICGILIELRSRPSTAMDIAARMEAKEETVRGHMAVMADMGLIEPHGTQWRSRGVKPIVWRLWRE